MTRRWPHSLLLTASFAMCVSTAAVVQSARVIQSTEPPVWGASVRLVQELRVGEVDGDESYLFGRISNVAIGKDGGVIVADDKTPVLRMYDAEAKFLRTIGRAGEGPGEYRSMGGVRTLPDGRILLWDNRIQRLTYYSAAGSPVT
jgi:6-bladed beta-propeller